MTPPMAEPPVAQPPTAPGTPVTTGAPGTPATPTPVSTVTGTSASPPSSPPTEPPAGVPDPDPTMPTAQQCQSYGDDSVEVTDPALEGVQVAYNFADGVATTCLQVLPGQVCMRGVTADAGPDYANWGAGLGLLLATIDDAGTTYPFDAKAFVFTQVGFRISGADGAPAIRPMMTMADDELSNYDSNAFVFDGELGYEIKFDGEYVFALEGLQQPVWSNLDIDGDGADDQFTPIDVSRLHSLQFAVVSVPGSSYAYDFCISDVHWM